MSPLVGLFLFLFIAASWGFAQLIIRYRLSGFITAHAKDRRMFSIFFTACCGLGVLVCALMTAVNILAVHEIVHLDAKDVVSIRVSNTRITDPEKIREIVQALNKVHYFEAQPGNYGQLVDAEVLKNSGSSIRFQVSWRRDPLGTNSGALLSFCYGDPHRAFFNRGTALCPELPAALEKAGVTLPTN